MKKGVFLLAAFSSWSAKGATIFDTVTITPPDVNTGLQIVTTELDDGLVAFWELGTVDWTLFYSNEPTVGIGFEYYVMSLGDRLNDQIAEGLKPIVTNLGPPRMAPFAFGQEQDPDGGKPPNFYMGFMLG